MLTRAMLVTAIALACSAEQAQVVKAPAVPRSATDAAPAPVSILVPDDEVSTNMPFVVSDKCTGEMICNGLRGNPAATNVVPARTTHPVGLVRDHGAPVVPLYKQNGGFVIKLR